MTIKLIDYRRVSTAKQGASGLGLEAQDKAIDDYVSKVDGIIIASYVEVETGTKWSLKNRPQLAKALAHAKRAKAVLVIAKLDRLSRNVAFLSGLLESKVEFVCCDNPHATPLTTHILAAVAQDEARMISERTKAALAAYKAGKRISKRTKLLYPDGVPPEVVEATAGKLGSSLPQCRNNLSRAASLAGAKASGERSIELAAEAYADLAPDVRAWREAGLSLRQIAARLNEEGHRTRRDKPWNQVQVKRILGRFPALG